MSISEPLPLDQEASVTSGDLTDAIADLRDRLPDETQDMNALAGIALSLLLASSVERMTQYAAALEMDTPVDTWHEAMKREVKRLHIQALLFGLGALTALRLEHVVAVSEQLRDEYGYLSSFAQDVRAGALSTAQIAARSALYSNHAQVSFWSAKDAGQKAQGFTQERRVLGAAEHCADCIGYAAEGWVPIGSLPAPGDGSVCRANCQCTKEYR